MSKKAFMKSKFMSRNAVIALLVLILTMTAAGTNAAGSSFFDSVRKFLGLSLSSEASLTSVEPSLMSVDDKNDVGSQQLTASGSFTQFGTVGTLSENFDTLTQSTTSSGFSNNSTIAGLYANQTSIVANNGGGNSGAFLSYGTNAASDRALGSLASGTAPFTNFLYGFKLTNNTGAPIGGITVNYVGEQWRNGGNTSAQSLLFDYQSGAAGVLSITTATGWTSVSQLNFTSLINTATAANLDGNLVANRSLISRTITFGSPVPAGNEIWIRWNDTNDSGNDHGLAIDDVSITALGTASASVSNPSVSYTGSPLSATVTCAGGGNASNVKYGGSATAPTDAGTYAVTTDCASSTTNVGGTNLSAGSFVINPINQPTALTVNDPGTVTFGTPVTLATSGGDGTGAVSFSAGASTGCSLAGAVLSVTDATGTCSVTATKAASTNYNAATSAVFPVTLAKANQTITFAALTDRTLGSGDFSVTATASSNLSVSFSSQTPAVCGVSGSTVSLLTTGVCTVRASQAGDSNFNAAPDVDQSFTVTSGNHLLSVSKAGNGAGTVSSSPAGIDCGVDCSESYSDGTSVTLTALPDTSSTFAGWSGACSADPCTVSMTAARNVTATFTLNTFNINASAGPNGSISPNGTTAVDYGASQAYTITPNAGYDVEDVLVDGLSAGAVTTYTFSNVTAAHTISATFKIKTYTITSSATGGDIDPLGSVTVNHGASQTFTLSPSGANVLSELIVDGVPVEPVPITGSYTFSNVTANHTIAATFSPCIPVSLPALNAETNSSVDIPITVPDVSGRGIISADFTFTYDQNVLSPTPSNIDVILGPVVPAGATLTVNDSVPGTVIISIFGVDNWSGAGTVARLSMRAIGALGSSSALTLTNASLNGGGVCTTITNGSVSISSTATTTSVTSSSNPSIYGTPVTFTATVSPIPTGGTVEFIIDGSTVAPAVAVNALGLATYTTSSLTVAGSPHSVTANYSGHTTAYLASSGSFSQTVEKAPQTISVTTPAPSSAAYGDSFAVEASATSGLSVSIVASGVCSGSGSGSVSVTMTSGTGTCTVTYSQAGDSNYLAAANVVGTTTATKRAATWTTDPASKVYNTADPIPLTTGIGTNFLPADNVTATYTRAPGEDAGTYQITATVSADLNNYTVTNLGALFTILKADQTITITTAAPPTAEYVSSFTVAATASSGLTVSITGSGGCSGTGSGSASILMTSGTSACTVTYTQTGNTNYNAAPSLNSTTTATKRPATWTTNANSKVFGTTDPDPLTSGTGSGFLPADVVTAMYTRAPGEDAGTYPITAALAPLSIFDNYTVTNNGALFTITQETQTITVTTSVPASAVYGSSFTVSATASSNLPVSISGSGVCSGSGTNGSATIMMTSGTGICTVTYSQAGNTNYSAAADVTETSSAAKKTASWITDNKSKQFGQADPVFTGSGSGFLPTDTITATYTRASGEAVSPPTYHITATVSFNADNYTVTNDGAELTILKADQTITIVTAAPPTAIYGTTFDVAATATSGLDVSITASGVCTGSGIGSATIAMTSGNGSCTVTFSQAGNGSYNAATDVTSSTTAQKRSATWTTIPASKLFGDADPVPLTTGSGQTESGSAGFLAADLSQITATYSRVTGEAESTYQISATLSPSLVLDNYTVTNNGALFTIVRRELTGTVTYRNALTPPVAVDGVTVSAAGAPPVASVLNQANGSYLLSGFGSGSYVVTGSKTAQNCLNLRGITSNDAAIIARHMVQLETLTPTQLDAAKVSGRATVSSFDAALIAQFVVCINRPGNLSGQWRFDEVPTSVGTGTIADFTGLLKGDVTGDWTPDVLRPAGNPLADDLAAAIRVSAGNVAGTQNSELVVPFRLDNLAGRTVNAYDFAVVYDPAVVEPATGAVSLADTNGAGLTVFSNVVSPGLLKVAVFGALPASGDGVYANLKFTATGANGSRTAIGIRNFNLNDSTAGVSIVDGSVMVASAAGATLNGRLLSANGNPVNGTRVMLRSSTGAAFSAVSNTFGYFTFRGLTVGETYTVTVKSREFGFEPRTLAITDSVMTLEMYAR